ncbi:hypothetical protein A7982_13825 [Minicystis rosea]|nr:hypothetical protein A7982_13825 [Minicystis rosea]
MASALVRVFARMTQHVLESVNRIPDQGFIAFLNLIGARQRPPRPARAPLTFHLADGAAGDGWVPAGSQVAAPPLAGETEEVVFETALDLVVTPAKLAATFVHRPDQDQYADRTAPLPDACLLAEVDQPIEHSLYLDGGDLFTLPASTSMRVSIDVITSGSTWTRLPVTWSYWDGAAFAPLPGTSTEVEQIEGGMRQLVSFNLPAPIDPSAVNGKQGRWIRASLTTPLLDGSVVPSIRNVGLSSALIRSGLSADAAFAGSSPLDLSLDFYPFGGQPRIGDAFFLASGEVFGKPGAEVTLSFSPSAADQAADPNDDPTLVWEVWTESGWTEVGRSNRTHPSIDANDNPYEPPSSSPCAFNDTTLAFTATGASQVTFTVPAGVAPLTSRGITSYWLRVRIAKGAQVYGTGMTVTTKTIVVSGENVQVAELHDNGLRPPIVASLGIGYTYAPEQPVAAAVSLNDFVFVDQTAGNQAGFKPFTHAPGDGPALYLGFDRPFSNQPMTLYVEVAAPTPVEIAASTLLDPQAQAQVPAQIVWEYAGPGGFSSLGTEDETHGLHGSGLVRFIGPADFVARTAFQKNLYWMRARLAAGEFSAIPRVCCVRTNTVWADNATTITGEVMGSGTGAPGQALSLSHTPVLDGQRIEVLEPEVPPPADQTALALVEGTDAVEPVLDAQGHTVGAWVRWIEVTDFYASGPRDRHYTLDSQTGLVSFGDGRHGMAPPQGNDNIRASVYRVGGGAAGDRAAETITQLKSTLRDVDGATNHSAATGGDDLESTDEVKDLGPRILRHGYYAVAAEDYEDLAHEASVEVARARVVTPYFDPVAFTAPSPALPAGHVLVMVVPYGTAPRPVLDVALRDTVQSYLEARAAPAVLLQVAGPDWVRVTAKVEIAPVSIEAADALPATARAALEAYLHPLTGGPDGTGWKFGALPAVSDLYPVLLSVDGVDHVRKLHLVYEKEDASGKWIPFDEATPTDVRSRVLVFSGSHDVRTRTDAGG